MDIKLLGITGTLGTAAIGGGVYLSIKESRTPISNLLLSEKGVLLITNDSDQKWNDAWKKYKEANNGENQWGIEGWDRKKELTDAPEEFKKECRRRSESKISGKENQEYTDVKSWCTRPKKISELLNSEGKRILLNRNGDSSEWSDSWTKYKKYHENVPSSGNVVTYKRDSELEVKNFSTEAAKSEVSEEYKNACQSQSEKYIDETKITEDPVFKRVEKWCTKERP